MDLASGANGIWISDRPGRGHLAILGPLGGPLATLSTDGAGLVVALPNERRLLAGLDAGANLHDATHGAFSLDDMVGLLTGDLPFDDAPVKRRTILDDGRAWVQLEAPNGGEVDVVLDPQLATPVSLVLREKTGRELLLARFEPFEVRDDGTLVPTEVQVVVPAMELTLELRFKHWEILDAAPPVFDLAAPTGWTIEPLQSSVWGWALSPQPGAHL
jgi:hypothetical protein